MSYREKIFTSIVRRLVIRFGLILLLLLCGMQFHDLYAQVMITATGKPSSLIICYGDGTFSLQIANTTGGTMDNAILTLGFPPGVRYTPGSVTGATELNITNLNQPVFSLPSIPNNSTQTVTYNAGLVCGYTNTQNFIYTVTYNSTNYTGYETPLQNFYYPEPVITSITNASAVIPVNQTVTRDITIQQQGANSTTDTLILLDEHTNAIQIISTSLGTLHPYIGPGPMIVDTIILTGSDFPGGNSLFDAGETIIVSETVKLVNCNNGQSTLKASWGCFGQFCNYYSAFPTVSPAAGTTSIGMTFTNNNRGWGFIDNSGWVEFSVTNNGTGAGTAFGLTILAGFSSGGATYYPNANWINKIDSFSVAGNYLLAGYNYAAGLLNGQYAFFTTLQFPFDPDGAGTGLEDADNDGFYDDLPPGKTMIIKAHTWYSWTQALTIPHGNTCGAGWTNSAWQAFRYGYDYKNQCLVQYGVNWIPNGNLLLFQTYDTRTTQHTIPPDLYDGVPVWMEHTTNTQTAVAAEGCPHDSVIYKLILPQGVNIGPGTATFKGVSMGAPFIIGDTVIYFLNRSRILSGGLFRVPLVAYCSMNPPSTGYIHAELKFWCQSITFPDRFFTYWCSNSPVFGIQCPNPSCTDPSITLLKTTRKTLGWIDNHLTARVTPSTPGLRLDNAMSRDTIKIEAAGKLSGSADSLYCRIKHDALPGAWANQLFFDFLTDTLYFYDTETHLTYTCANLSPQVVNGATSSLTTYFGNLTLPGNCLSGITFTAGDSLYYVVYGQVKNVAVVNWNTVPVFRAYFFKKSLNLENYCNSRGVTFNVLGSNLPGVATTSYQQIVLQGCTSFQYEGYYYRSLKNCGGDISFPNEIRPFVVLDTIIFTLPEGFLYQAGSAVHSYNLDNTGGFGNESIPDPLIDVSAAGTRLTFIRNASWNYSDFYDCWLDRDVITFYATPSCKANGNYDYLADARGRYQFMADGIGVHNTSTFTKPVSYTPPLMDMIPLITTAEGKQDTVLWKIRVCNDRSFAVNNSWVAFESASGGIQITDLKDITNPSTPVTIPLSPYGTGKTWAVLGNFAANACKIYQVRAVYTSCFYDSVLVRQGYNCAGNPINPELGYPPSGYTCAENDAYLYLDPKDVSLNLSVISPANPVDLCDTLIYETEVTNSQPSIAYHLKLTIAIPPGVTIISGLSQFKYPYTTGTFVPVGDPVNIPAGSNKWVYDISADPNGVSILKGVDSIPKNGYRLKFGILTNCDFISGKSLKITASATNACGDEKSRTSFTQQILVSGLPTNTNLYVVSAITSEGLNTCSQNTPFYIKIINLGPGSVSNIEKVSVSLDDAFDYAANSLVGIHNGPSGLISNSVNGGIRYLYFGIQPNLTVNDSIVFTFELHDIDPGSIGCDTIPVETSTLLVGTVYCPAASGDSCVIQSITSTITTEKPVIKDLVGFGSYSISSIPNGSSGETITVFYKVKNTGTDTLNSTALTVAFIHDANNNGLPDDTGADSLFSQTVPVGILLPGDSISSTAIFPAPGGKVCNMLAALRLKDNGCICGDAVRPLNSIHLFNAGPDTLACQLVPVSIGSAPINGYSYIWIPSGYLSSPTVSDPDFTFTGSVTQPDTLTYTLVTTRIGNCFTRDTCKVIILPAPVVYAGRDTLICSGTTYMIGDSHTDYAESFSWTTNGSGTFNNPLLLHPVYTPGVTDIINGSVILTLHATGLCGIAADEMLLLITQQPEAFAGNDTAICNQFTYSALNASALHYSTLQWSRIGDGTFSNASVPNPVYTPGPADITNGFAYLILTLNGNPPCSSASDTMKLTLNPPPVVTTILIGAIMCSGEFTDIALTASQPGSTFSWTASLTSGFVTGFSNGSGSLIQQQLFNPGTVNGIVTYSVTPSKNGCIGPVADFPYTVKPLPVVINSPPDTGICSGSLTHIILLSTLPSTTYTWTATGSSANVTGYSSGSGPVIQQLLSNSGFNNETVTYHIVPHANGCTGNTFNYVVTVYPVADVWFNPASQTICGSSSCNISVLSHVAGATFSWTATASSPALNGYSAGSGSVIVQIINNTGYTVETVTYHVTPATHGCPGVPGDVVITVKPLPVVSFQACRDIITTTAARPFKLKGGLPLGGTYAGAGVSSSTGMFTPGLAGPGSHTLTYTYTNTYSCTRQATLIENVVSAPAFSCGNNLTDVRDGKIYPTVPIGSQCWMAANLAHGALIAGNTNQRDNCLVEKYCYNDNAANCTQYGGYYQWDEIMQYEDTEQLQGLCPPGWHVPSLNDWNILFSWYLGISFAGSPLVYTGYSGFNALLSGTRLYNQTWYLENFATHFWTSTSHGSVKSWAHAMNTMPDDHSVSTYPSSRSNAFPVRCLKD